MSKRKPTARGKLYWLPVDDIIVGPRFRKDMGDIPAFAEAIAEVGQILQPLVVKRDARGWTLVAGKRRLLAAKHLGWIKVPAYDAIDLDDPLVGEFAENTHRQDFMLSEAVAIKRELEAREREQARKRKGFRTDLRGKLPAGAGRLADKAARFTRTTRRTLEKAEAIVDAAEAEPEKYGKLLADMDRTGRVNGCYERLCVAKQAALIRAEPPPLPGNGPYRVIVADPPWPYEIRSEDPSHRGTTPYPQMSIAEICALNVAAIAAPDCILWLWTTNYHILNGAREVLDAWGFTSVTVRTWKKPRAGLGKWLRGITEHVIMAVRGKPIVTLTNQTSWFEAPTRGHSVKPPEFYDFVESLCPAPRYADLFSRYKHNDGWDCHGDEAPYDAGVDLAKSYDDCLREVRGRVADGGKGWTPK